MTKRELIQALESWTDVPDDALVLTWHDRTGDLYEAAPQPVEVWRRVGNDYYDRYNGGLEDCPGKKAIMIQRAG